MSLLFLLCLTASNAWAQQNNTNNVPSGIAEYQRITGQDVTNGSVISLANGQYQLADQEYSSDMAGVYTEQPALAISKIGRTDAYPVTTTGTVEVRVNNQNGAITEGDFITSSTTAGLGMRATQSGYILGTALAAYDSTDEGLIPVAVNIRFVTPADQKPLASGSLLSQAQDVATIGIRAVAAAEPNTTLRYLVAALVLIASILFGFLLFGRSATNGLIAIGRNPLAKRSIFIMMLFNIVMTVGFAGVGLALAIAILAL